MRFAPYGRQLVAVFALALFTDLIAAVAIAILISVPIGILLAVLCVPLPVFGLAFFRDPVRHADTQTLSDRALYAPADGKVVDIAEIENESLGGKALRIGIFLSIVDVHINRTPCTCKVISVERHEGQFLDARNPRSSEANCSADLTLEPKRGVLGRLPERIIVRQIAGKIARRIVCDANADDELTAGQRFGMIMFGSRTELIVPADDHATVRVIIGQKVLAGNDLLIEYG